MEYQLSILFFHTSLVLSSNFYVLSLLMETQATMKWEDGKLAQEQESGKITISDQ